VRPRAKAASLRSRRVQPTPPRRPWSLARLCSSRCRSGRTLSRSSTGINTPYSLPQLWASQLSRLAATAASISMHPFPEVAVSNCSGSSWRSGAQAPYRSRLGWSAGALRHVLSSHTGSFLLYLVWELRSHPFYLIKSLYNYTSTAPISSVPLVKRSTVISPALSN